MTPPTTDELSDDVAALVAALRLLYVAKQQLINEPREFYQLVFNASWHLERQLKEVLRSP